MGKDFWEKFPKARAVFERADETLGKPFSQLIFNGPSEELMLTKNSQLALFITSLALLRAIEDEIEKPLVCAGLSLGEYTALVAAGKLHFEDGLALVEARAVFMQRAAEESPGGMHVVVGLTPKAVESVIASFEGVWIANLNTPNQVVISGRKDILELIAPLLKKAGARKVSPLNVSGAFHSGLMNFAQKELTPLIKAAPLEKGYSEIVMNVSGRYATDLEEVRANLAAQVTQTTYWQKGIEAIQAEGIELFIEIGTGKTLAGMNKRIGTLAPTISIEKVEDLKQLTEIAYATS